jgi:serine/threonine protein kinase/tetratricopeptide (TPR) repeat protein
MEFCGLVDSPASLLDEPRTCAKCRSAARLGNGLCLKCLLYGALDYQAADSARTKFKGILAELDLRDRSWRVRDYEILEEIGRGGMGVIYRARELHCQRIVALKRVLNYHADSDHTLARFRREAETATKLDHPNIVPIYYVAEDEDGLPFFSMKFASGGSLLQAREGFRRDPRQSVSLMAKVAVAIQYAHEQGVLHRDLKPSNILLSNCWEPMVSDFGLAKWLDTSAELTRTLTIFGTPGYIAPEQAAGDVRSLAVAADIYSLGAILFELLAGRPPFLGEHALAVIRLAAEKPAPRLRSLAPQLDRDLETICARCLEREPSERYQSARSLAQDLQKWSERRPILARPVSIPARLWRWFRRNRTLAGTLTVVLLLVATSLLAQMRSWKLESAARESALTSRSVAVLPFLDLDRVAPDEVASQSVASSLQRELNLVSPARIRTVPLLASGGWRVAEQIREASKVAKVRAVLTGTERTLQGKKRTSLRLLSAATGEPLLARVYEYEVNDKAAYAAGKDISGAIDRILSTRDWSNITQSEIDPGLRNNSAKEAIMAGREFMSRYTAPDYDRAIALFREALQVEPNSSLAHSYLAIAAAGRTHYISDLSFLDVGREEARKAIQLSPGSSDARRALAGVYYQEGKFSEALEEQLRTIEIGGLEEKVVCFIGLTLDVMGRSHQALIWYRLASMLTERPGEVDAVIGDCWAKLCDDEQASWAYKRAANLRPANPQGPVGISHIKLLEGNFEEARKICQTTSHGDGNTGDADQIAAQIEFFARQFDTAQKLYSHLAAIDPSGGGSFYGAVSYQSALGRIKQALGYRMSAKALLEHCLVNEKAAVRRGPENPEAAYRLAAVEASLSMSESSFEHLRAAVRLGWIDYRSLALDPRFDSVRQTPEFNAIIEALTKKVTDMRLKSHNLLKIAKQ